MGAVDSDDTPFGQGEDFAFCLLASGGVRFAISSSWSVWVGFLWQHLSNAGISEPRRRKTSLDSIGPVAGVSYAFLTRANPEINFRNGGSAEGSLARRGGRPIPRKGWDPFFPPRLGLPTQHSQRPLKGMGPLLPIRAPALSQAILSEVLGRRPGRNGLSAVSSAQGQGRWTLAFASSVQTGHFASAIWKFLSGFALI